ncbi:MAG: hypothetical protein J0H73_13380, partial [Salana multivorans]|nr:hypothetical protein [Salana multivorans]
MSEKQVAVLGLSKSLGGIVADQRDLDPFERQLARGHPGDDVGLPQPFGIEPALRRFPRLLRVRNQPVERTLPRIVDDSIDRVGGTALPVAVEVAADVGG